MSLAALLLVLCMVQRVPAQTEQVISFQHSDYYTVETVVSGSGDLLEKHIIGGPPQPPAGFELERATVSLIGPEQPSAVATLTVPAYKWIFGCSAVSGAMIAAYYDRNGYPNMYTGPANGGLMPLTSSPWTTWIDGNGATYQQNPLIASRSGLDGRATRGSLDDYWEYYLSGLQDPYITNGWTPHTWGDAIGDYMKTSQSAIGNNDGSTTFYTFTESPDQLTCSDMVSYEIDGIDGTYGRKLFYEARGYSVGECYNQKTDNTVTGGFSFAQFKAEIDAGRPVLLNLDGHSVVGIGYDDATNTVYLNDTWDYNTHEMIWGGSYGGYNLLSVSVVAISTPPLTTTTTVQPTTTTTSVQPTTTTTSVQPTTTTTVAADSDSDGIPDSEDNCPATYNPQQLDADEDGIGDVCDATPGCGGCGQPACESYADEDGDGIADVIDNCPGVCNAVQLDADEDGIGDVCDATPGCGGCGQPACETPCTP